MAARCIVRNGKLDRAAHTSSGVENPQEHAQRTRRRLRLLPGDAPHPRIVYLSAEAIARHRSARASRPAGGGGRARSGTSLRGPPRYAPAPRAAPFSPMPLQRTGSTCWPSGGNRPGFWPRARDPSAASSVDSRHRALTRERCVTARSASGPPSKLVLDAPMTGRAPRSAILFAPPSHCGWPRASRRWRVLALRCARRGRGPTRAFASACLPRRMRRRSLRQG